MLNNYKSLIENKIEEVVSLNNNAEYSELFDAMKYSISAGGKRIRPALMMEFATVCGKDPKIALNFATALEMIHTYSLIHDDLPCMDDDDLRRGKPSCHIAFSQSTALLTGDALLTEAFSVAMDTEGVKAENIVKEINQVLDGVINNRLSKKQVESIIRDEANKQNLSEYKIFLTIRNQLLN